jgi:hypothetical protein
VFTEPLPSNSHTRHSILNIDIEKIIHKKNEKHYEGMYKILRLSVHRSPVTIGERVCINQCLVRNEGRGIYRSSGAICRPTNAP